MFDHICDLFLNDVEFQKDLFIAIITMLVSLITLIITNFVTWRNSYKTIKVAKEQFEKDMKEKHLQAEEQKRQYEEQLTTQREIYDKIIKRQNLIDRVGIMPYFELDTNLQIVYEEGILKFPIRLANVGNGTAIRTYIKIQNLIVYDDDSFDIKYYQCKPMSTLIVRCNEYTETMIKCEYKKGPYEVQFTLCYEDMMQRQYEQRYSFYYEYDRGTDVSLEKHFEPECIKDI